MYTGFVISHIKNLWYMRESSQPPSTRRCFASHQNIKKKLTLIQSLLGNLLQKIIKFLFPCYELYIVTYGSIWLIVCLQKKSNWHSFLCPIKFELNSVLKAFHSKFAARERKWRSLLERKVFKRLFLFLRQTGVFLPYNIVGSLSKQYIGALGARRTDLKPDTQWAKYGGSSSFGWYRLQRMYLLLFTSPSTLGWTLCKFGILSHSIFRTPTVPLEVPGSCRSLTSSF